MSADLRAALGYTISENRDGSDETDLFPLARLRGALAASPTPWLEARGRFAVFFNEETEDLSFRVAHENDLRPGDVTIDELWVELRPDPRVTIRGGRLQIEDPPFELDSVVLDSLSRHDSSGLDPEPTFLFVPAEQVVEVARREGAVPFDVPGVELGHHGQLCSFDAFLAVYKLTDPALHALADIVRGADTNARDLTPESWGLYAIASGFREIVGDDHNNLARQLPVYDALYAYCRARRERGGRTTL